MIAEQLRLGGGLVLRIDRDVVKRNVVRGRELVEVAMIRDDRRNLDRQITRAITEEQVVQTVAVFGDHDRDPRFHREIADLEGHRKVPGDRRERGAQRVDRLRAFEAGVRPREGDAHEKPVRPGIAELRAVDDVAAVLDEKPRYGVHDADRILAREGQRKISAVW